MEHHARLSEQCQPKVRRSTGSPTANVPARRGAWQRSRGRSAAVGSRARAGAASLPVDPALAVEGSPARDANRQLDSGEAVRATTSSACTSTPHCSSTPDRPRAAASQHSGDVCTTPLATVQVDCTSAFVVLLGSAVPLEANRDGALLLARKSGRLRWSRPRSCGSARLLTFLQINCGRGGRRIDPHRCRQGLRAAFGCEHRRPASGSRRASRGPESSSLQCADLETVGAPMPAGRRGTAAETPFPR